MADAKKCDRCGELYELSDKDDVPTCCGRKVRKVAICSGTFDMGLIADYDLCPSCAKAAMSFLFYKKENKNEGE